MLVFDFQNNFRSISSAASVYCPFPRRSFLSLFIVIRMRRISSVEKVAFLSAGTESIFSIGRPGFSVLWQVPFLDSNRVPVLSVRYFCLRVSAMQTSFATRTKSPESASAESGLFSHLCIKTVYQKSLIWLPCYVQLVYCYSVIVEKEIILW